MNLTLKLSLALLTVVAVAARPIAQQSAPTTCSPAVGARLTAQLTAQLTPWLDDRAASHGFSGVVAVGCHGQIVYSGAYGKANRATGEANTIGTAFNLGSMNKMWTAIAVAELVERGKIDVNAPVGKYLPDLTNATIRDQVLVRHLLTHTSGLGSYFMRGFLRDRVATKTAAEYLPFFIEDAPAFTPGERMQYSNAGFALLGAIVERVSGVPYFDFIKANVLDRAKMTHASFADVRTPVSGMAVSYGVPPGGTAASDMRDQLEAHGGPAGGAYATAADLIAFGSALRDGAFVGAPIVQEFTTGKVAMGPDVKYAYGFGEGHLNGWRHIGHNGGAPGVGTEFLSFPEHDIDIVVLTNIDMPAATQAIGRAARIVTGQDLPFAPPAGGAAFSPAPLGPDGWPASEMGQRAARFMAALSAGGATYQQFIETEMVPSRDRTAAQRAAGAADLKERFGTLTMTRVVAQTNDSVEVLVSSEKQGPVKLIFDFESAPPHRIAQVDMKPGGLGEL